MRLPCRTERASYCLPSEFDELVGRPGLERRPASPAFDGRNIRRHTAGTAPIDHHTNGGIAAVTLA